MYPFTSANNCLPSLYHVLPCPLYDVAVPVFLFLDPSTFHSLQDIFGQCKCLSIDMFKPSALSAFTIFSKLPVFKSLLQLLIAFQSLSHMGSFKCYVTQMGVGGCPIVREKCYEGVWFNVIGVTRGWVGVQIPGKKHYVTLESPLCGVRYIFFLIPWSIARFTHVNAGSKFPLCVCLQTRRFQPTWCVGCLTNRPDATTRAANQPSDRRQRTEEIRSQSNSFIHKRTIS